MSGRCLLIVIRLSSNQFAHVLQRTMPHTPPTMRLSERWGMQGVGVRGAEELEGDVVVGDAGFGVVGLGRGVGGVAGGVGLRVAAGGCAFAASCAAAAAEER